MSAAHHATPSQRGIPDPYEFRASEVAPVEGLAETGKDGIRNPRAHRRSGGIGGTPRLAQLIYASPRTNMLCIQ